MNPNKMVPTKAFRIATSQNKLIDLLLDEVAAILGAQCIIYTSPRLIWAVLAITWL